MYKYKNLYKNIEYSYSYQEIYGTLTTCWRHSLRARFWAGWRWACWPSSSWSSHDLSSAREPHRWHALVGGSHSLGLWSCCAPPPRRQRASSRCALSSSRSRGTSGSASALETRSGGPRGPTGSAPRGSARRCSPPDSWSPPCAPRRRPSRRAVWTPAPPPSPPPPPAWGALSRLQTIAYHFISSYHPLPMRTVSAVYMATLAYWIPCLIDFRMLNQFRGPKWLMIATFNRLCAKTAISATSTKYYQTVLMSAGTWINQRIRFRMRT